RPIDGLGDTTLLENKLQQVISAAAGRGATSALILIDLKHFGQLNAYVGRERADRVLLYTARRMQAVLQPSDVFARLHADAFCVILTVVGPRDPSEVASDLAEALGEPLSIDGWRVRLRANMGIACYPDHGADGSAMVRGGAAALEAARRSGAAQVMADADGRSLVEEELSHAEGNDGLLLHYLPQVAIATGM